MRTAKRILVKHNFFRGREETNVTDVRRERARWVMEIAGLRNHGTTGKRPAEVFAALERTSLLKLPEARYEVVIWKKATVLLTIVGERGIPAKFTGEAHRANW